MAACSGFEHIFEKPLMPLQSLSPWKYIKTVHHHSFTEIFGQLYSKENNDHVLDSPTSSSPSSTISTNSSFPNDENRSSCIDQDKKQHKRDDSVSSMNSESCLSTCTEVDLGFESSDEDLVKNQDCNNESQQQYEQERRMRHDQDYGCNKSKRCSRRNIRTFPPPISCIGRNGKPWVCFKSFRKDGRFILKEIRIPTQEFLHACRENGRLKMQFIQSDDEFRPQDHKQNEDENNEGDAEVVRAS